MKKRKTRKTAPPTPPEEFSNFRAIIIDDEADARDLLRIFLKENYPNINILAEADSVQSGLKAISQNAPDLVFLDVQMQDGTGFDLLKQLPKVDFRLIFVTSYDQYAIEAFRHNAIDYLLKPIDPEEFESTVKRLLASVLPEWYQQQIDQLLATLREKKPGRFIISTFEGHYVIPLKELIMVESEEGYTYFVTERGDRILTSKKLSEVEKQLTDSRFFRPHNSYIVNLEKVRRIVRKEGDMILLEGGHEVPLARRKRDSFYRALSEKP